MAPEQTGLIPNRVGPGADIYALGVILYELLTGRPPFRGDTPRKTLAQVRYHEPTPPRTHNSRVDSELEAVCLKCLEKKPSRRYGTAGELANDLGRWLRGERTVARPKSWPARAIRALRRHWVRTAAAVFVCIATVATQYVRHLIDPDRPLEEMAKALAAGKPVEPIGETGLPKWSRWVTDYSGEKTGLSPDGTFYIRAARVGLLELVPDPQWEHYTFSVELRRSWADASKTFAVGVYFLHNSYEQDAATIHCFGGLSYFERKEPGPEASMFELCRLRYLERAEPHQYGQIEAIKLIPSVTPAGLNLWRKLIVHVSPYEVRTSWARAERDTDQPAEDIGSMTYGRIPEPSIQFSDTCVAWRGL